MMVRSGQSALAFFARALCALFLCTFGAASCGKTDDRPYVWAYLSPAVFQPHCASASCHSQAAAVAGLDFSTPERGYRSLTGLHVWIPSSAPAADGSCEKEGEGWRCPSPRPFIVPYAPGESRLMAMLRARNAPRMPPDRPLTAPDIALIEAWILNGASQTAGVAPPLGALDAGAEGGLSSEAGIDGSLSPGLDGPVDRQTDADADGRVDGAASPDAREGGTL